MRKILTAGLISAGAAWVGWGVAWGEVMRSQDSNTVFPSGKFSGNLETRGTLTVVGTATVQGNAFSVGASSFTVSGGSATVAYRMTAASYAGDGSALTGIAGAEGNTYTSSKTFTSNVDIQNGSTLTVSGNAFSVGGSTLVVKGGMIGIGTTAPAHGVHVTSAVYVSSQVQTTAVFLAGNGGLTGPAFAFGSEKTSGLYLAAANNIALAVGGIQIFQGYSTGLNFWGGKTFLTRSPTMTNPNIADGTTVADGIYIPGTKAVHLVVNSSPVIDVYASSAVVRTQLIVQGTATVQGNAFSIGGSSFTVAGGSATVAYNLSAGQLTQALVKSCATGLTSDANGLIDGCVASDLKLKQAVVDLSFPEGTIDKLRPVVYRWKPEYKFDGRGHLGFIAQDVRKVLPDAVVPAGEGVDGIDSNALIAVLVKETQSLRKRVLELEKKVKQLAK